MYHNKGKRTATSSFLPFLGYIVGPTWGEDADVIHDAINTPVPLQYAPVASPPALRIFSALRSGFSVAICSDQLVFNPSDIWNNQHRRISARKLCQSRTYKMLAACPVLPKTILIAELFMVAYLSQDARLLGFLLLSAKARKALIFPVRSLQKSPFYLLTLPQLHPQIAPTVPSQHG